MNRACCNTSSSLKTASKNILSYINLEVMTNMTCLIFMRKNLIRENTNITKKLKITTHTNTHKNEL